MQEKWESFGKKNWKNAKKDTSRKIGGRLVIGDIRRKKIRGDQEGTSRIVERIVSDDERIYELFIYASYGL